jgi:hypothetical protein
MKYTLRLENNVLNLHPSLDKFKILWSIFKGKIRSIPLKDHIFRKIPLKNCALEKYHWKAAPLQISTTPVKLTLSQTNRSGSKLSATHASRTRHGRSSKKNTSWPERTAIPALACARPLRSSPAAPCRGAPCRPWRISSAPPPVGSLPRPALAGAYPRRSLRSSPAPARREAHRRRHVAVDARAGLGQSRPRRLP